MSQHAPQTGPLPSPQSSQQLSPGVYFLFKDRQLVYVGRSKDCPSRVRQHDANGRPFDFALLASCSDDDAEWVERALLVALEPAQNRFIPVKPANKKPRFETAVIKPGEHPLSVLNKTQARDRVRLFGLRSQFEEALRAGQLQFRPKNPAARHSSAQAIITLGELIAWCEKTQRIALAV